MVIDIEPIESKLARHREDNVTWAFHQALTAARRREYFMRQARLHKSKGDASTTTMAVGFAREYQHQILRQIRQTRRFAR